MSQLIATDHVERGRIGIVLEDINSAAAGASKARGSGKLAQVLRPKAPVCARAMSS